MRQWHYIVIVSHGHRGVVTQLPGFIEEVSNILLGGPHKDPMPKVQNVALKEAAIQVHAQTAMDMRMSR